MHSVMHKYMYYYSNGEIRNASLGLNYSSVGTFNLSF
jgi:hypothetical protein